MKTILGQYSTAVIFTDDVDAASVNQVVDLCNSPASEGSMVSVMPDIHAGDGGAVGTAMTVHRRIVPSLVGVDIGCGVECVQLRTKHLDLRALDAVIHEKIPTGGSLRKESHSFVWDIQLTALRHKVNMERARMSLGTLGGGSHFIEVGMDTKGTLYLMVHAGSRQMGMEISAYYQKLAAERHYKRRGPGDGSADNTFAWLEGEEMAAYLNDLEIAQEYADLNRKAIVETILSALGLVAEYRFSTVHNTLDTTSMILRRGAVSAKNGERLLIAANMRDGCLVCLGKGNVQWNFTAPHGAGRVVSRAEACRTFTVSEYMRQIEAVYSTTVGTETLGEAPMAFRGMDEIWKKIADTADVIGIIRPMYNFKAVE